MAYVDVLSKFPLAGCGFAFTLLYIGCEATPTMQLCKDAFLCLLNVAMYVWYTFIDMATVESELQTHS